MATALARSRRGRRPDPEKRGAILRAATRLFLERGFVRTQMDAVAAAAGVAKVTVYTRFGDKDGLFQAVVRARCDAYNRPARFEHYAGLPPREALLEIARNMLALLLSREALGLHRVIVAEAARHPKIARLFFEAGPERTTARIAGYLREATTRGLLSVPDPEVAVEQLVALVKGRIHFGATLNLGPLPSPALREAHVQRAVDFFLRAYGVNGSA